MVEVINIDGDQYANGPYLVRVQSYSIKAKWRWLAWLRMRLLMRAVVKLARYVDDGRFQGATKVILVQRVVPLELEALGGGYVATWTGAAARVPK